MFKNNFFLSTACRALKKGTRSYGACSKTQTAVYTVSGIFSNSFKMSQLYGCRHFEVVLLIFFVISYLSFSQESLQPYPLETTQS